MVKTVNRQSGRTGWIVLLAALLLACLPACALASGEWLTLSGEQAPEAQDYLVTEEYTGTVRITFLGDCTLGGESKNRNSPRGFVRVVEEKGFDWPFRNLTALTVSDDLTVANLEGVLTDRFLPVREKKTFNFTGSAAYTGILQAGSVECVTLANNHSHDYDLAGYRDTKAALEAAGVAYFGTDCTAVWRNAEGLMIGFIGVSGSLSGDRSKVYREQAEALRSFGCAAVITVMHAGSEYIYEPDRYQKQIAERAVGAGSCLVVGHHPHVVQGYEILDGVPVVYSLGNCVFGGNANPRDHDALVLRADLSFEEGTLTGITLRFYPVSVSGEPGRNDYSPVLLNGGDAERVLKKMEDSTGVSPGAFDEENGAAVTVPVK